MTLLKTTPSTSSQGYTLSTEESLLVAQAIEAAKNAYAPYSHYFVGTALLSHSGKVYTGCNVENDSYGLTICSERNALTTAVAAEKDFKLKMLATIISDPDGHLLSKNTSPCGACRQFILQFSDPDTEIVYAYDGGFKKVKVTSLLPDPFLITKESKN